MQQNFTILFDLDGTLVDTAPDLMRAHNHVMKKFGYPTKSTEEIRNLVGQGAGAMLGRSIWGQAKKEFGKVQDEKIKKEMIKDFTDFYGKNIVNESTLINGVKDFLIWSKENNISMAVCTNKTDYLAVDLLKKIVSGPIIFTPTFKNFFRRLFLSFCKFNCFIYKILYIMYTCFLIHIIFLKKTFNYATKFYNTF